MVASNNVALNRLLDSLKRHWGPSQTPAFEVLDGISSTLEFLTTALLGPDGPDFAILANPLGLLFRGAIGDPHVTNWQAYANVAIQSATCFRHVLNLDVPNGLESSYQDGFNQHLMISFSDVAALFAALRLNTYPDYLTTLLRSQGVYDFDVTWPYGLDIKPQRGSTTSSEGSRFGAALEMFGVHTSVPRQSIDPITDDSPFSTQPSSNVQQYNFYYAEFFTLGSVYLMRQSPPDISGALRLLDIALQFPAIECPSCQNCRPYSAARALRSIYSHYTCKPTPPHRYSPHHDSSTLSFTMKQFEAAIQSGQPAQAKQLIDDFCKGNDKDNEVPGKCFKPYVIETLNQLKPQIPYRIACHLAKSVSRIHRDALIERMGITHQALEQLARATESDSPLYPVRIWLEGPVVNLSDPLKSQLPGLGLNEAYDRLHESLNSIETQTWKADLTQQEVNISIPAIKASVTNSRQRGTAISSSSGV